MTDLSPLRSPIARMACILAGSVCLFTFENIWLDPRLARRFDHRLPSFIPEAMTGTWLFVLMLLAIAILLAVVCQILLFKDARLPASKKFLTALLVLAAIALSGKWIVATGGTEISGWTRSIRVASASTTPHSVTLRWNASPTPNVRYNVYRGTASGSHPDKLTPTPINQLTFTDTNVQSGTTYYYVTRAIDPSGHESSDSNQTTATIP